MCLLNFLACKACTMLGSHTPLAKALGLTENCHQGTSLNAARFEMLPLCGFHFHTSSDDYCKIQMNRANAASQVQTHALPMPQNHLRFASRTLTLSSSSLQSYRKISKENWQLRHTPATSFGTNSGWPCYKTTPSFDHYTTNSSALATAKCQLLVDLSENIRQMSHNITLEVSAFESIPQQARGQPHNLHCTIFDHLTIAYPCLTFMDKDAKLQRNSSIGMFWAYSTPRGRAHQSRKMLP